MIVRKGIYKAVCRNGHNAIVYKGDEIVAHFSFLHEASKEDLKMLLERAKTKGN